MCFVSTRVGAKRAYVPNLKRLNAKQNTSQLSNERFVQKFCAAFANIKIYVWSALIIHTLYILLNIYVYVRFDEEQEKSAIFLYDFFWAFEIVAWKKL